MELKLLGPFNVNQTLLSPKRHAILKLYTKFRLKTLKTMPCSAAPTE